MSWYERISVSTPIWMQIFQADHLATKMPLYWIQGIKWNKCSLDVSSYIQSFQLWKNTYASWCQNIHSTFWVCFHGHKTVWPSSTAIKKRMLCLYNVCTLNHTWQNAFLWSTCQETLLTGNHMTWATNCNCIPPACVFMVAFANVTLVFEAHIKHH